MPFPQLLLCRQQRDSVRAASIEALGEHAEKQHEMTICLMRLSQLHVGIGAGELRERQGRSLLVSECDKLPTILASLTLAEDRLSRSVVDLVLEWKRDKLAD